MASMLENNFNLPQKTIEYQRIMMVMTIMEEIYYAFEGFLDSELIDMEKEFSFVSTTTPIEIELNLSWIKIIEMSKLVEELNSKLFLTDKWDQLYFVGEHVKSFYPGTTGAAEGKIDLVFLGMASKHHYDLIIGELKINKSTPEMIGQGLAYLTSLGDYRSPDLSDLIKQTISNEDIESIRSIEDLIKGAHLMLLDQWANYEIYQITKKQLQENDKVHYFCFGHNSEGEINFGHPENWNCIIDTDLTLVNDPNPKIISEETLDQISNSVYKRLNSSKISDLNFSQIGRPGRLHRRIKDIKKEWSIDIYGQVTRIHVLIHKIGTTTPIHSFPVHIFEKENNVVHNIYTELNDFFL